MNSSDYIYPRGIADFTVDMLVFFNRLNTFPWKVNRQSQLPSTAVVLESCLYPHGILLTTVITEEKI